MTMRGEEKQKRRIAKQARKRASRLARGKRVRLPLTQAEATKYRRFNYAV